MLNVNIAVNGNRIFQIGAVNLGAEPGEDIATGVCRYEIVATEILPDGKRCIPETVEVRHRRSDGALPLVATICDTLTAERPRETADEFHPVAADRCHHLDLIVQRNFGHRWVTCRDCLTDFEPALEMSGADRG